MADNLQQNSIEIFILPKDTKYVA